MAKVNMTAEKSGGKKKMSAETKRKLAVRVVCIVLAATMLVSLVSVALLV